LKLLNRYTVTFWYQHQKFPRASDARIKEGIFVRTHTEKLMNYRNFDEVLEGSVVAGYRAIKLADGKILANGRASSYRPLSEGKECFELKCR